MGVREQLNVYIRLPWVLGVALWLHLPILRSTSSHKPVGGPAFLRLKAPLKTRRKLHEEVSQAIYNSIIFNFMKDRDSFGERVSPTPAIRTILHGYPFPASILRELLQRHGDGRSRSSSYARAGQAYVVLNVSRTQCAHILAGARHINIIIWGFKLHCSNSATTKTGHKRCS